MQYAKAEWEVLAEQIFASMEADGSLGKFFPATSNPYYYNDTLAMVLDPTVTRESALAAGFLWRDTPIRPDIPEGAPIVNTSELAKFTLPDGSISEEVLSKVIQDDAGNIYRIIPMELEFLSKHHLPLPSIHWVDRLKLSLQFR